MRKEHDFLGELEVADELYYGVQTIRALENFHITGKHLDQDFIKALAMVKKASALANMKTGRLNVSIGKAIVQAADESYRRRIRRSISSRPNSRWCRYFCEYEHE